MKGILEIVLLAFILILASIGVFSLYKVSYSPQEFQFLISSHFDKNELILNKLSLEQKIGQLFIIGIKGKEITAETENLIKKLHPGGILLLERNIEGKEQLKKFIDSLQKIALEDTGLPLFIAVDQEGGEISRVKWLENISQSEIENSEQAKEIGKRRGEELKELEINLNLAPLLDASFSEDFIFKRTFQKNSEIIEELAEGLVRGQKESGILTSIKHFPGYGRISFNPEEKLAIIEELPEIFQFEEIESEMIMVSNVIYKEIDEKLPFSFSEKGIKFLKEKNKKNYLVISDDLSQNSLLNEFSLNEIVGMPIKAGVDILIFSGWREPVENGILAFRKIIESSEISKKRIDQSVLKIIKLKSARLQNFK